MTKLKDQITWHHRIPKELWWTNYRANMEDKRRAEHIAHHTLFNNKPPHEQILQIVDTTGKAFNQVMRHQIIEVVDSFDIEYMYHPKAVNIEQMIRVLAEKLLESKQ